MRSPARYGLGFTVRFGKCVRRRIFFLFACPKRKNQRETTLGRGRLRFLPLPRPTLMETPKRGDPLLDHPRAVRIRPGLLHSFGSSAGRGRAPPLRQDGNACLSAGRQGCRPLRCERYVVIQFRIPNSELRIIRKTSSLWGPQAAGRRGADGSQTSYPAWARRPRCPRPARRSGWRWARRYAGG